MTWRWLLFLEYIYLYIYIYSIIIILNGLHGFPGLSLHSSLSSIASGRFSRLHSVPVIELVGRPTQAYPEENVVFDFVFPSPSVSRMFCSSVGVALEMGGKNPYSCCFVGCYSHDLFNIARCILVQFPSSFFSICLVNFHVVHPYSRNDTTTAWKHISNNI